jgi:hypothetical protein
MRPPRVPLPTPALTPDSGTKLPSTCDAPPAVLLNVGSVLKTLSSRILPQRVQHLLGWGRGWGGESPSGRWGYVEWMDCRQVLWLKQLPKQQLRRAARVY